jgi:hypothetical protein
MCLAKAECFCPLSLAYKFSYTSHHIDGTKHKILTYLFQLDWWSQSSFISPTHSIQPAIFLARPLPEPGSPDINLGHRVRFNQIHVLVTQSQLT